MIVVDASAALAWCFEDEYDDAAGAVLDDVLADGGLVPPLWFEEVSNALLAAERRGRLSEAMTARYAAVLDDLPLEVTESDPSTAQLVNTARSYDLTTYDALYLITAMESGLPLATRDAALIEAAHRAGVQVK